MKTDSIKAQIKKEWKKEEKNLYLPKALPVVIEVPSMNFFVIEGQGNPNDAHFSACIEALFGASYAVRMSYKGAVVPEGYHEYTVYPLEGVWDLTEVGKEKMEAIGSHGVVDLKDELVFKLMIRQPEFLTPELAAQFLDQTAKKKKNLLTQQIRFEQIEEGLCVQMLHEGPYDDEPASFARMEAFARSQGLTRLEKTHREIYLSDERKTAPEKLKTVLRFRVE